MYWMTTPLLTLVHDNETKKYRKSETSKLYAGSNVHNYNIFYNYMFKCSRPPYLVVQWSNYSGIKPEPLITRPYHAIISL
jgi:hypothetical protein